MKIKTKYHNCPYRLQMIDNGDWIDLYVNENVHLRKGEFKLIPLGISMQLPEGYEANIVPRSSTFSKFGIIQTNSFGVIDNPYCGDNDEWFFPAYATRDVSILRGTRICQFRLNKTMREQIGEPVVFEEVDTLGNKDRGGHGTTGV